jgi:antitoxin VapB
MTSQIAKIFMNGRSQAVRLPKEFRFDCEEVYVTKQGDKIIISPSKPTWDDFFSQDSAFDDNYLTERDQTTPQERDVY